MKKAFIAIMLASCLTSNAYAASNWILIAKVKYTPTMIDKFYIDMNSIKVDKNDINKVSFWSKDISKDNSYTKSLNVIDCKLNTVQKISFIAYDKLANIKLNDSTVDPVETFEANSVGSKMQDVACRYRDEH